MNAVLSSVLLLAGCQLPGREGPVPQSLATAAGYRSRA